MAGIYIIENNVNGMVYVGKSLNVPKRIQTHQYLLRVGKHKNKLLQKDFDKYGENSFSFTVLCGCPKEDLSEIEYRCIRYFWDKNPYASYNNPNKFRRKPKEDYEFLVALGRKEIEKARAFK